MFTVQTCTSLERLVGERGGCHKLQRSCNITVWRSLGNVALPDAPWLRPLTPRWARITASGTAFQTVLTGQNSFCSLAFWFRSNHRDSSYCGHGEYPVWNAFNPLKPELNPICYLLALLAHHFLHVSRIRVKSLTFRRLMSYIYIYIWSTHSWCF